MIVEINAARLTLLPLIRYISLHMKFHSMKKFLRFSSLLLLIVATNQAHAQSTSWKGTLNVNWNSATNWTNGIPDATKDVIIGDASFTGTFQPKVNVVGTCKSLVIGGVKTSELTFNKALTVSGNITINPNGTAVHPGAEVKLSGNWINNGTYISNNTSSKLTFAGTNQTISGSSVSIFRKLTINAGCNLTLAKNIKVDSSGALLAIYGILEPVNYVVTSTGITRIFDQGKIKVNTADFTSNYVFAATVTIYPGAIVEYCSSTVDQIVSSRYTYSTLILTGGTTKYLIANMPSMYGRDTINGKLFITTGTTFDLKTFTAIRAATKVGGEINIANGAFLKIAGTNNFPVNYAIKNIGISSTVEYNGGAQTISPQSYGNLYISTAGIKTCATAFSTRGNCTIENATLYTSTTVVTHSIAGNFTMTSGSLTGTNYTYMMNGTANQTLNVATKPLRLTINNTGGTVNLASDITVSNTLNFIKGNIQTAAYNVIIPATATVTGAGQTTGWVNGNLQKPVTAGSSVFRSFEIGGTNYAPASILFTSVSAPGNLTASTGSTDQPEIDYSGLNPAKSVNRFWSLNNGGILFSTATIIFNWQSPEVDGGSVTSSFKTGLFNGTNWGLPSSSSPLPTSIQANGLTSLGDFSVGEIIGKSTWTGAAMTSDWFTPKNWLGLIPSTTNPTVIPNGLAAGRVYPVLTGSDGVVSDITVENAASLTVSSATLKIAGTITSNSNINATAGTIELNGSSVQTIPANTFTSNTIKNLNISNDVDLMDVSILTGTLTVANGKTLYTNDFLVLKSDANGTARIAALPVNGSGIATAYIDGDVSIERFIPARKAWRLLSAPINSGNTTTLQDSWQESAYSGSSRSGSNPNPHPGYGVHITGGSALNGYDQSPTNSASVKIFNNATNTLVPIPSTPGTFTPLNTYQGYFVYIRGDRGIDLSQGNNAATTKTTLRMKGGINTGNKPVHVNPTNFTTVGNPYPSAVDFGTLTRSNVKNSFYIWDPKLAGANGLGAYVTVSWNSTTGTYDVSTSASAISRYIPSGEAILVESVDGVNPGTITFKESDKTANGSDALFGRQASIGEQLRVNLYEANADGTSALLDGVLTTYSEAGSNNLDNADIKKIDAGAQSIGLQREAKILAIERKHSIVTDDTSFLNITQLISRSYKLEIIAENLTKPGFTALLKDKFSAELNNTVLNTNGSTEIIFEVTANAASYAADRFSIVFEKVKPKVFAFKSVTATQQQRNIAVDWKTENESAIVNYTVQTSADGIHFNNASLVTGQQKLYGTVPYAWFDLNAIKGDHYYRIRAVSKTNEVKYSGVVKLYIADQPINADVMTVYPNPVRGNTISIQVGNVEDGIYTAQVLNINGQVVKKVVINHYGGDLRYSFLLDGNMPPGKYHVQLNGEQKNFVTPFIKE